MSIPVWKWRQLPSGGSQLNPVQPNSWVTVPDSGHWNVPLYSDGTPPPTFEDRSWRILRSIAALSRASLASTRRAAAAFVASFLKASCWIASCRFVFAWRTARRAFAALRSARLPSRTFFWAAVAARSWPVWKRVSSTVWLRAKSVFWSFGDLLGKGLVLVADVDQVADVGDRVGERVGRQDGLEHRRPVAVVGGPDVLGEERLALLELGVLGVLLGLDLGELGVEVGELADLGGVERLDGLDLRRGADDLGLDRGQVGVDPGERLAGRLDRGARGRPGGC